MIRRIVIDTSVLVAALRSPTGASRSVLRLVGQGRLVPLATTALFLEYEAVLKRPEHLSAHALTLPDLDRFLAALASVSEAVDIHFQWRPQLTDPADEMVLEAAINGRADGLVTHNVSDFAGAAPRFGLRVLLPGDVLKEVIT